MSVVQIERCAARIRDPIVRLAFEQAMRRADLLVVEAANLRRQAWSEYREATGEVKRFKVSDYA